jgi:hypothetical protein
VEGLFVSRDVGGKDFLLREIRLTVKESSTALSFSHTVISMAFKAHAPLL